MFKSLHLFAYSVFPLIVPTPASKIPPPPTFTQRLDQKIQNLERELQDVYLQRSKLRAKEQALQVHINELEVLRECENDNN